MKRTAIEFLVEGLPMVYWEDQYYFDLLEQAKEIEKQQKGYNEKEVISLLIKREYALDLYDMVNDYEDAVKWFEQFKI